MSRLTAQPEIIFFHSESGNSGQSGSLTRERLVALGSIVYVSIILSVLVRVSRNTLHLRCLSAIQAYADSLTLILLASRSPSDSPSEIDTTELGECCNGLKAFPIAAAAAAATSESWLSIVAMKDPNAASDLPLSSLSAFASLDWISMYTVAFEILPSNTLQQGSCNRQGLPERLLILSEMQILQRLQTVHLGQ